MKLTIAKKLSLVIATLSALTSILVGGLSVKFAQDGLVAQVDDTIVGLTEIRADALQSYLDGIGDDVIAFSDMTMVLDALTRFSGAFKQIALEEDPLRSLQDTYIHGNPHPVGEKHKLSDTGQPTPYAQAHKDFHPNFLSLQSTRGYYDIFLIDADGNIVYSVFKELDFATNLTSGQYSDSDLGRVFRAAVADASGGTHTSDFRPYAPSSGAPASFVARRVVDQTGNLLGVLAFQMPFDAVSAIMQQRSGLGETGETFLLSRDFTLQSDLSLIHI